MAEQTCNYPSIRCFMINHSISASTFAVTLNVHLNSKVVTNTSISVTKYNSFSFIRMEWLKCFKKRYLVPYKIAI